MTARPQFLASCACGQVALEASGALILSAVCYCESCRTAGRQFEQAPGAPSVFNGDGGVDYCLYRKDRVRIVRGGEHLKAHRLTDKSATAAWWRRAATRPCSSTSPADTG